MEDRTFFAPQLFIRSGVQNVDFYMKAFGAIELRCFSNDDGSIHVSELSINGAIFHLHEETLRTNMLSPEKLSASTVTIGLFVQDVHAFIDRAVAAGAIQTAGIQDFDYGYRQGEIKDPFGHTWLIEMKI